jgi:diguanylate cyclase (GGDEF)-like protein/PAS domain S-box-containing protein
MTLRKKTPLIIAVTLLGLLAALYFMSRTIVLGGFAEVEHQQTEHHVDMALNTISGDLANMASTASDWSAWDETYTFIEGENASYIDENIYDDALVNLRVNLMVFVDSSGRVVYAKAVDLQEGTEAPVPQSLLGNIAGDDPLLRHPDADSAVTGIVLLPENPLLVASTPIVTSAGEGPIRGTLILGRYLNAAAVEQLAATTGLSLSVHRLDDPQVPPDYEKAITSLSDESPVVVRTLSSDRIAGYAQLNDVYDNPALALRVDIPRSVYAQGRTTAEYFMVALLALGAVFGVVITGLLEKTVLSRLARLRADVKKIGATGDLAARVSVSGGDELSDLGRAIDGTLESLERSWAERQRAEGALRESEVRHRTLLDNLPQRIFLKDTNAVYVSCNENYARDLNIGPDDIAGKTDYDFFPKELAEKYRADDRRVMDCGKTEDIEEDYVQNGERVWVQTVKTPVRNENGDAVGVLGIFWDITARKQAEEALRRANQQLARDRREIEALNRSLEAKVRERTEELRLANEKLQERNRQLLDARAQAATDSLTGLWNHRAFHERIRKEVRLAQETGSPLGVIMMDIDDFKRINDSYGHLAGDQMLRELAVTITEVTKREDTYRYGGDEFALLLPSVESQGVSEIAERLRRAVERRTNGEGDRVTVSLGVASFPDSAASAEELIYGADAAMYWAKSGGKNRVAGWDKLLRDRADADPLPYRIERGARAPDTVAALAAALSAKDPITAAHTERCSWYTTKLAQELGLPEEQTSVARLASLLHDIGKLAVPDEVLLKPGPLNEEEWDQMKQHPAAALHVLGQIRAIADAAPAVLHHHEHFDGSGYPDGLAGEDIPIASRILLVTDAFDAMTTDRPYRKAMSVEEAIDELRRNRGSQFDPAVVDAFLELLAREGPQPLRRKTALRVGSTAAKAAPSDAGGDVGGL